MKNLEERHLEARDDNDYPLNDRRIARRSRATRSNEFTTRVEHPVEMTPATTVITIGAIRDSNYTLRNTTVLRRESATSALS